MREEVSNLVHPVLAYGLRLKERLERNEPLDLATEQTNLKGLLQSESQARRWPDFGGDGAEALRFSPNQSQSVSRTRDQFWGVRYALACWLDEIFTIDSPWAAEWNERKLEEGLYGSNERAWMFWDQARRAEARGTDAVEGFYLCVVLGFRGDLRQRPEKLQAWRGTIEARIAKEQNKELRLPEGLDPPTYVPPLAGRARFQRMLLAVFAAAGALILVGAFVVITALRS